MSSGDASHRKKPSQSLPEVDGQGGEDAGVNQGTLSGGPNDPNNKVIFVHGLDPIVNSDLLRQVFSQIGNVFHVHIPQGKAYGFVEYSDRYSAERAMASSLNNSLLGGRRIKLSWGWGVYNHMNEWKRKKPENAQGTDDGFDGYVQGYDDENTLEADDNNSKIHVGNCNSTVDNSTMGLVFGEFGKLVNIYKPSERFGFVQFAHRSCAERALRELDGLQLGGEIVQLNWSHRHGKPQRTRWNDASCPSTQGNSSEADESNKTILIEGLDPTLNGDFCRSLFAQSGEIAHMEINNGSGYVQYAKSKDAKTAVEMYNGLKLGKTRIRLLLTPGKNQREQTKWETARPREYDPHTREHTAQHARDPNVYYAGYTGHRNFLKPHAAADPTLLEIQAMVRKWWKENKVFSAESREKPGENFFGKFAFDSFRGHAFSLSSLDESGDPAALPVDVMRFSLAYIFEGAVDDARILSSSEKFVFETANTATLKLTNEISWIKNFLAADFSSCLRKGPSSTFGDKVFENEMNIALNRTEMYYQACQFQEAIMSGFLELQDARDWYMTLCGGPHGMNHDLLLRFIDVQTCLIAPICPHYAEYVWRNLLKKVDFVVDAGWPAADAADDSLQRANEYLKDLIDSLKKQNESEFRCERSQGLKKDNEKGTVPELASNLTGEDANVKLLIYVKEEPEPLLTFDEAEVLTENLDLIKRQVGVQEVQVFSATKPDDLAKAGSLQLFDATYPSPGKPSAVFLPCSKLSDQESRNTINFTQVQPTLSSSGCAPTPTNPNIFRLKQKCIGEQKKYFAPEQNDPGAKSSTTHSSQVNS